MKVVDVQNLTFSYHLQESPTLRISKLQIDEGEKVFIHGPSGSGKSTLLNILTGILDTREGEVTVFNQRLDRLSRRQRDRFRGDHLGIIFQNFNLIPYLNVLENVIFPIKISTYKKKRLKQSPVKDALEFLEHLKLENVIHKNVSKLSVGQQQRVAVARAFIGFPNVIIADEPTSSLDEEVTKDFIELLLQEHRRRQEHSSKLSLIFVSHDKRLEHFFDRTLHMKDINKR